MGTMVRLLYFMFVCIEIDLLPASCILHVLWYLYLHSPTGRTTDRNYKWTPFTQKSEASLKMLQSIWDSLREASSVPQKHGTELLLSQARSMSASCLQEPGTSTRHMASLRLANQPLAVRILRVCRSGASSVWESCHETPDSGYLELARPSWTE